MEHPNRLEVLIDQYENTLYRAALAILGNPAEAEDAVQDTFLRTDSIIYGGYSEPQALTAVDELLLRLLYHPNIRPGMNAQECEAVIRSLYY